MFHDDNANIHKVGFHNNKTKIWSRLMSAYIQDQGLWGFDFLPIIILWQSENIQDNMLVICILGFG